MSNTHRRGLRRPADHPRVPSDFEGQLWAVGIADVDDLTVVDVDHRHPAPVHVGPVQRTVVDSQPAALLEAQQQVRAGDQRMRDPYVGAKVTSDDHIMARCKSSLRSVVSNCQRGRRCLIHRPNCSCSTHCIDCIGCDTVGSGRYAGLWRIVTWPKRPGRRSRRSGCGCRSSACTGCSACMPNARCAARRRPRAG